MLKTTKIRTQLLGLVDSDSEDGLSAAVVISATNIRKTATTTKPNTTAKRIAATATATMPPRKKAAANKVTKPAAKTTRRAEAANNEKLTAAVEQTLAENAQTAKPAPKGRGGRKRGAAAATPEEEEETQEVIEDSIVVDSPAVSPPSPPPAAEKKTARGRPPARGGGGRKAATASKTPSPVQEEITAVEEEETTEIPETQPAHLEPGTPLPPPARSVPPLSVSPKKRSSVSSSAEEATLRRRLGDLTKQNQAWETKYRDLRDLTIPQAEKKFDAFKKSSEEKSKVAENLISTLKAELAAQRESTRSFASLQQQLETSQSQTASLEQKVKELTSQLAESKTEIKALNMKLTAARNAEAAANSAAARQHVPGSAMKGSSSGASRLGMAAAGGAASEATLAAQKKEDLYGDLTGLIVRSVKRENDEDMFDCIQTGRNGTLHFKLTMYNNDEAQCEYNPLLDENRDRALIEVLPEFLVDEIAFPRTQASKFYQRIMKALNDI
ncbi:chromosome segregation protein Csm1/Pcs1-domain-containing protein [Podospora australis]|uniref:Chromosome segregation protein Csm1/Pcs1-domain-containing protein n=1 Tax=Podospora australis TaxID=1536484 RepID=A0AAN6X6A7_9PEZI|nr:chromosome segregation protein Csm1/Pcs1-domain-containing protein [Podospora australis]